MQEGLIDEFRLSVHPILLGAGTPSSATRTRELNSNCWNAKLKKPGWCRLDTESTTRSIIPEQLTLISLLLLFIPFL
ncbi:hypothetical protein [Arcticibacter sp.]|uniref:hypothetical protein n=1 Tax=Arcticibacter sp. TaxID=1872630 RepID=UPI00388DD975